MTYKTICSVENNQVIVTLPPHFSDKKQVTVCVDDQTDARSEKLDALKMAAVDPLFLADIREINADFATFERESLSK
jgi:hypothetical protein